MGYKAFRSDAFYERLRKYYTTGEGAEILDEVYWATRGLAGRIAFKVYSASVLNQGSEYTIRGGARDMWDSGMNPVVEEIRDAAMEKLFMKALPKFATDPRYADPETNARDNIRERWLRLTLNNACKTYRDKLIRQMNIQFAEDEENGEPIRIALVPVSLNQAIGDEEDGTELGDGISNGMDMPETEAESREKLQEALESLFSLNAVGAEKLLICAAAILTEGIQQDTGRHPMEDAAKRFSCMTIGETLDLVERYIKTLKMPTSVMAPLKARINAKDEEKPVAIDGRALTKRVSDVRSRLRVIRGGSDE